MSTFATGRAQSQQNPYATSMPYGQQQGQQTSGTLGGPASDSRWSHNGGPWQSGQPPVQQQGGYQAYSQQQQGGQQGYGQQQGGYQQYGQAMNQGPPQAGFHFAGGTDWMGNQYTDPNAMMAMQGAMAHAINQQRQGQIAQGDIFGSINPQMAYNQGMNLLSQGWQNPFAEQQPNYYDGNNYFTPPPNAPNPYGSQGFGNDFVIPSPSDYGVDFSTGQVVGDTFQNPTPPTGGPGRPGDSADAIRNLLQGYGIPQNVMDQLTGMFGGQQGGQPPGQAGQGGQYGTTLAVGEESSRPPAPPPSQQDPDRLAVTRATFESSRPPAMPPDVAVLDHPLNLPSRPPPSQQDPDRLPVTQAYPENRRPPAMPPSGQAQPIQDPNATSTPYDQQRDYRREYEVQQTNAKTQQAKDELKKRGYDTPAMIARLVASATPIKAGGREPHADAKLLVDAGIVTKEEMDALLAHYHRGITGGAVKAGQTLAEQVEYRMFLQSQGVPDGRARQMAADHYQQQQTTQGRPDRLPVTQAYPENRRPPAMPPPGQAQSIQDPNATSTPYGGQDATGAPQRSPVIGLYQGGDPAGQQGSPPGYGTPPDQRDMARDRRFLDRDGDGVDDRDQDGPGMPKYGRSGRQGGQPPVPNRGGNFVDRGRIIPDEPAPPRTINVPGRGEVALPPGVSAERMMLEFGMPLAPRVDPYMGRVPKRHYSQKTAPPPIPAAQANATSLANVKALAKSLRGG